MLGIQWYPHTSAGWLESAWLFQASLTFIAVLGMVRRLVRRQRKLDA